MPVGAHSTGAASVVRRSALTLLIGLLAADPLTAQTVELSSRTFWLGRVQSSMTSYPPFFVPQERNWIEKILDADPVLRNTVIHVELTLNPVSSTLGEVLPGYVPLGSDKLDPRYDLPGYRIVGGPVDRAWHPTSLQYLPQWPGAGFYVNCGVDNERGALRFCLLIADYPPDDRIRLKARLYFPDLPAESPNRFREVAERMRDLVYCLDVTDEQVNVQETRPTLAGCRPEPGTTQPETP